MTVFVSHSEIVVPLAQRAALEQAFTGRAHFVDGHAGFLGLELLKDLRAEGRYVLLTRWRQRADFVAYMRSGDHARAHERPHPGLDPADLHGGKLQQFHVVVSEELGESVQP
jgi:heme oxygenase (mycobilin-producing)